MSYLERFHVLIDRAEAEEYTPQTGPWLEEAWDLAREHTDIPNAVLARYLYMFAVAPLEPAKALVAFSWCIAHADEAEAVLPGASLAQLYGIAIGILRSYPEYTLEQIETTFQEMERQYRQFGLAERDIFHHRIYMSLTVGDRDGAEYWYNKWMVSAPETSACAACDRGTQALYHLHREQFEAGIRLAQPLLDFRLTCAHGQPLMTHAAVLVPMVRNRMFEEAAQCHRASSQLLRELGYAGIWVAGRQLGYLALIGELEQALEHFERFAAYGLQKGTPADRFGYLLSLKSLARLTVEKDDSSRMVKELNQVGVLVPNGAAALRWVTSEVDKLAAAFDRRNLNGEFSRIVGVFDVAYEELATER